MIRCNSLTAFSLMAAGMFFLQSARAGSPSSLATAPAAQLRNVLDTHLANTPLAAGEALAVIGPRGAWQWQGAAGFARRGGPLLTADHAFRIASVTKPFTAAAILRLMEDGRLDIDAPLAPLISSTTAKQLVAGGYAPNRMTVRQLLAHTSGLFDYVQDPSFKRAVAADPHRRWTRAEQIAMATRGHASMGAPGEHFAYSDTGYVILGEILERMAQRALGPEVRALLDYNKLGLLHTWWEIQEPRPANQSLSADAYWGKQDMGSADPSFDLFGGGGLVSTVGDLARFYRALVTGEVFRERKTLAVMMSVSEAPLPGSYETHTNAVHLVKFGPAVCWGHAGFWGTLAAYCPTLDIAFAWTMNQAEDKEAAYDRLLALLYAALTPRSRR